MCDCVCMYVCMCLSVRLRSWGSPVLCNFLSAPHPPSSSTSAPPVPPPLWSIPLSLLSPLPAMSSTMVTLFRICWLPCVSCGDPIWSFFTVTVSVEQVGQEVVAARKVVQWPVWKGWGQCLGLEGCWLWARSVLLGSVVVRASKTCSSSMILGPGLLKVSLRIWLILSHASSF